MYLALALMESQCDPWVLHSLFSIRGGFRTIGTISAICADLYAAWHNAWPTVTATMQLAPESYDPATLPPNVGITPAGHKRVEASRHRVIAFQWNGTTIHGGIGSMEGRYDELAGSASAPKFRINPEDRWDIAARLGWNAGLFIPAGFSLIIAAAFFAAGRRSQLLQLPVQVPQRRL